MRIRSRGTTLVLAGLLAVGGVAGCAEGEDDGGGTEQEGDVGGEGGGEGEDEGLY
jgi:hypothetical protein